MFRLAVVALVLLGCGSDSARTRELEVARRSEIAEVVPADLDKDGVLDLIVGYGPTMKDKPGTRFSVLEGIDGKTGRVRWTSRLPRWLDTMPRDERTFAVGADHVALTWTSPDGTPAGDYNATVSVHELATGRLVWQRTFPGSQFWTGNPFRVWTHGALLLVLANTHLDRNAKTEHVLFAFDFATGTERWTLPIARARSAPIAVGDTLVMSSQGDVVELDQLLLVDAKTGVARVAGARLDTYDMPIIANGDIWMACEHWDRFCRTLVDTERGSIPQDWLARVDPTSATPRAVTLPDGTPQPLGGAGHATWIARYQDSVIVVESITSSQLTRTRLGERTARWTYQPRGAFGSTSYFSNYAAQAPDAAYLRDVPGRYLPLFVTNDEGSRIVILDLDTGTASWQSEPFTPGENQTFIVRGSRYYAVLPAAGNALLAINANTGKLDGVYQIAIGDEVDAPVVTNLNDLPNPWHFQGGMLVGHWRRAQYWMIDLNASKLQVASPGVKLLTPWNDVERVLGPVPRAITL